MVTVHIAVEFEWCLTGISAFSFKYLYISLFNINWICNDFLLSHCVSLVMMVPRLYSRVRKICDLIMTHNITSARRGVLFICVFWVFSSCFGLTSVLVHCVTWNVSIKCWSKTSIFLLPMLENFSGWWRRSSEYVTPNYAMLACWLFRIKVTWATTVQEGHSDPPLTPWKWMRKLPCER